MATTTANRSFHLVTKRLRPSCQCLRLSSSPSSPSRQFSACSRRQEIQHEKENGERPRWSYTPEAMTAPFPPKPRDPTKAWDCNNDPARLDAFYTAFFGPGGAKVLTEEIKWLAITHKSFDQGRRGFNDRLAFFGRRIINLQATIALLNSPTATQTQILPHPSDDRIPFTHPALEGLRNLTDTPIGDILTKQRLALLATQMGMRDILRWKPRMPDHLKYSGIEAVLTTTLYAIVGAVALQKGSDAANKITRERILKPLGIV